MLTDVATYLCQRKRIVRSLHSAYPNRNDLLEMTAKDFAKLRDPLAKASVIRHALDSSGKCCALLVHNPKFPHIQVAFFEATKECTPHNVQEILDDARSLARIQNVPDIIAGINGHVTHGIGFLTDHHDAPIPFDVGHTPKWYSELWESVHPHNVGTLQTHAWNTNELRTFFTPERTARFHAHISVRTCNLRKWKQEIASMTRIINASADDMPYYFTKSAEENYFLMRHLRWLLRPEHMLFAVDTHGDDVGVLFWYDDPFSFMPQGHSNAVELVARYKMAAARGAQPERFVVNMFAVLPQHKRRGTIFALLHKAAMMTRSPIGECTFGADENELAIKTARCTGGQPYKHYKVFWFQR